MTDHECELLKWVAEELLGWEVVQQSFHGGKWYNRKTGTPLETLQSWDGIGLVIQCFKDGKGDMWKFNQYLEEGYDQWWFIKDPWLHVFHAARKAVTNDRQTENL